MKLFFFGSSGFSVPALRALRSSISLVVTKKAKPKGRGYLLDDNEVKQAALSADLPLAEIGSFKDDEARLLADQRPDLLVVVSFGLIIPRWFLDVPSAGAINVHPSLLPKYRGPSPMQWAVRNGDAETGITIIAMTERMDAGDILYQEKTAIGPDEDMAVLSDRLSLRAGEILPPVVEKVMAQGMAGAVPQDEGQATYTSMVTKEMGLIDWNAAADEVLRQVRCVRAVAHRLYVPGRQDVEGLQGQNPGRRLSARGGARHYRIGFSGRHRSRGRERLRRHRRHADREPQKNVRRRLRQGLQAAHRKKACPCACPVIDFISYP